MRIRPSSIHSPRSLNNSNPPNFREGSGRYGEEEIIGYELRKFESDSYREYIREQQLIAEDFLKCLINVDIVLLDNAKTLLEKLKECNGELPTGFFSDNMSNFEDPEVKYNRLNVLNLKLLNSGYITNDSDGYIRETETTRFLRIALKKLSEC